MVFYREGDNERPPLSLILPHLYLGAERDVTQDSLSARGISYVLSVSRCSPQPTFLPVSQYLRIPIDDSLRDDLLPWIPAALRFIDGAMSSGGAVLVHCAAGISRSPALAVAYIMYSMGMDLDHAYRFVKERRPSISPNFNFLGQLQHFQGSLRKKSLDGSLIIQPLTSPNTNHSSPPPSPPPSHSPGLGSQGSLLPTGGEHQTHTEEAARRCFRRVEVQNDPSEAVRSLSRKLQTLDLTLNLTQSVLTLREASGPGPCRKPTLPAVKPPAPLHLPTGNASLLEKRRSLTLALSTAVSTPPPAPTPTHPHRATPQAGSASIPGRQTAHVGSAARYPDPPAEVEPAAPEAGGQRQWSSSSSSCRRTTRPAQGCTQGPAQGCPQGPAQGCTQGPAQGCPQGPAQGCTQGPAQGCTQGPAPLGKALGGRAQGKSTGICSPSRAQNPSQKIGNRKEMMRRGEAARRQLNSPILTTIVDQQPSAETKKASSTLGPEENVVEDQSPLSPLNLTINKLLGWGERMLLGVLLGPQIKMGQAALPYRC